MRIDVQRRIDWWLGIPLCALLSIVNRLVLRRPPAVPGAILVILLSEAGSMVCAQPMLRALKARYPKAALHALVLERNRESIELLGEIAPERIHTIGDSGFMAFLFGSLKAVRRLRAARIDTVIDCELFARVSAIFAFLSGAGLRVGFHRQTQEGLYRGSFMNRPVSYNPYRHIALQFLGLASALESQTTPFGKGSKPTERPEIVPIAFDRATLEAAAEGWRAHYPGLFSRPLVLIYAGGGPLPVRAWPADYFEALAAALIREGYAVALIGLEGDRLANRGIVEHCASPYCVDLAGQTRTLRDLLLLLHCAVLLVSNDGGPMHFAALTPIPVLAFFGPETPLLYGPLSSQAHCLFRGLPCAPCLSAYNHRRTPCDGDNQCLKQISVAEALQAARRLIGGSRIPRHTAVPLTRDVADAVAAQRAAVP